MIPIVLCFELTMAALLLSYTERNLLSEKISQASDDKMIASEAAEAGLLAAEETIQHQVMPPLSLPSGAHVSTQIKLVQEDNCHKYRYGVSVHAEYHNATVVLESLYDYLPAPTKDCRQEKINQRVFWRSI